jgi:hypothetical protein
MVKTLLSVLSLAVCGLCNAGQLTVIGTGTFSATDTPDAFVIPGDTFTLQFVVPAVPTITCCNSTSVSFDVPVAGFTYFLNGTMVSVPPPSEITFYTVNDGGGYAVDFGPSTEFLFGPSQIFAGTTAAPTFSPGNFANQDFVFFDANNVDANSATVTVTTPEPSTGLLLLGGGIALFAARKFRLIAGFLHP